MSDCLTSVQSFGQVMVVPEEQFVQETLVCNDRKGNTAALSQDFYHNRYRWTLRGCRLRVTVLHAAMLFACHTLAACELDRVFQFLAAVTEM